MRELVELLVFLWIQEEKIRVKVDDDALMMIWRGHVGCVTLGGGINGGLWQIKVDDGGVNEDATEEQEGQ